MLLFYVSILSLSLEGCELKVTESSVKQKPLIKTESLGKIILADYSQLVRTSSTSAQNKLVVDTSTIIHRGEQCIENYDYENAIKLFEEAIAINPNDPFAYNRKGDALDKLERLVSDCCRSC